MSADFSFHFCISTSYLDIFGTSHWKLPPYVSPVELDSEPENYLENSNLQNTSTQVRPCESWIRYAAVHQAKTFDLGTFIERAFRNMNMNLKL